MHTGQCCRVSRNIAYVTPETISFYYHNIDLQYQSIKKNKKKPILIKPSLVQGAGRCEMVCNAFGSLV